MANHLPLCRKVRKIPSESERVRMQSSALFADGVKHENEVDPRLDRYWYDSGTSPRAKICPR